MSFTARFCKCNDSECPIFLLCISFSLAVCHCYRKPDIPEILMDFVCLYVCVSVCVSLIIIAKLLFTIQKTDISCWLI